MINNKFIEACKGIVMHCECSILILNVLGEYKAFLTPTVRLKTRECRYHEVIDAQDITTLVQNIEGNFQTINRQRLDERTQSIHKESFKFGTDDYLWITKVNMNVG